MNGMPIEYALPIAAFAAFSAWSIYRRRAWSISTREVAESLGLEWSKGAWNERPFAAGRIGADVVRIERYLAGSGRQRHWAMRIRVDTPLAYDGLTLSRESALAGITKVFTGEDVEIGADAFDRAIKVGGAADAEAISWLGCEVRAAAMSAIDGLGAKLACGEIKLETPNVRYRAAELEQTVRTMLALSSALKRQPRRIEERLLANATEDPIPAVRARNLRALVERHRPSREVSAAIERARDDRAPIVRVIAAAAMGDEGLDRLLALAASADAPSAVRAQACLAIGPRFLSNASARAEAKEIERSLVGLLDDPHEATAATAARALAFAGSLDAVPQLLAHAEGLMRSGALKSAAKEAVADIRARIGGEGGRLSLAAADGGELSLEQAAGAGALSLEDAGGALSVAGKS
jgi:hypothetical protein